MVEALVTAIQMFELVSSRSNLRNRASAMPSLLSTKDIYCVSPRKHSGQLLLLVFRNIHAGNGQYGYRRDAGLQFGKSKGGPTAPSPLARASNALLWILHIPRSHSGVSSVSRSHPRSTPALIPESPPKVVSIRVPPVVRVSLGGVGGVRTMQRADLRGVRRGFKRRRRQQGTVLGVPRGIVCVVPLRGPVLLEAESGKVLLILEMDEDCMEYLLPPGSRKVLNRHLGFSYKCLRSRYHLANCFLIITYKFIRARKFLLNHASTETTFLQWNITTLRLDVAAVALLRFE